MKQVYPLLFYNNEGDFFQETFLPRQKEVVKRIDDVDTLLCSSSTTLTPEEATPLLPVHLRLLLHHLLLEELTFAVFF